jgi:uncharacterized 2Fe-2S/4Fe-4S cluster protein (DUF4445 family)
MEAADFFDVQFQPIGKHVKVLSGTNLLEAARQAGIDLTSDCGGEGSCGQCQIGLLSGEVTPPNDDEEFILTDIERANGTRLACCTKVQGNVKINIPRGSMITGQVLQTYSDLGDIKPDPFIRTVSLSLAKPTLEDTRSDITRILDGLAEQQGQSDIWAGLQMARAASRILRDNNWQVNIYLRANEIVGLARVGQLPVGFAVDLGTTKIAAYLIDMETGKDLASAGAPNPQIGYGEDVISRLSHAYRKPQGDTVLASKVRETLNELLGDLVKIAGIDRSQVADACIVGNTAMIHLLLRLPVHQLATAPYVPAISTAIDIRSDRLDLEMAPGAYVHIPPCIGGFVGADHVAMILASELDRSDRVTLGIDIGTNSEITLRVPGQPFLSSASCASGPAFEGAHISDGMRAATGAIEKVRISPERLELVTIDHAPAVGLCGSGIIDTVAGLYQSGYINRHGRFQRGKDGIREGRNGPEYLLVPARKSGTGRDIVINQKDINEIQLAKGAIQAGMNVLMEVTGITPEAIEEVIVAGAFGSYLNIQNAIAMGLFPDLPNATYRQVGNAAAIGAKWILLSKIARQRAQEIAAGTHYNELTTYSKFRRQFALGMLFPE